MACKVFWRARHEGSGIRGVVHNPRNPISSRPATLQWSRTEQEARRKSWQGMASNALQGMVRQCPPWRTRTTKNVGQRPSISKSSRDRHRLHRRRSEHSQQQQKQLERPVRFLNEGRSLLVEGTSISETHRSPPGFGVISQEMCQAAAHGT